VQGGRKIPAALAGAQAYINLKALSALCVRKYLSILVL
jgi:hypothetical protein